MKELALIDGDLVVFRCAATAENDPQEVAEVRCDEMLRRMLHETDAINYKCFLTGRDNFRKQIYPEYKANRKDKPRPKHLQACRDHLQKYWKAEVIDGREADDELGIEQTAHELTSIICSIDKDLLQIPGYHFNFVRGTESFVSPFDGMRNFYSQLVTGDATDNIPAFDGKFRTSVPKFVQRLIDPLWDMTDEYEMWKYVYDLWYDNRHVSGLGKEDQLDQLYMNAKCLWIQRKEGEFWQEPIASEQDNHPGACTSPD